mgnify:CR=1 FL=1
MENLVLFLNKYVINICQLFAMIIIIIGIIKGLYGYARNSLFNKSTLNSMKETRMEIGNAFSLGLGFLIGASILKSFVAPTWDDIGKLSAIIAIRTVLNFFLMRDIQMLHDAVLKNDKMKNF